LECDEEGAEYLSFTGHLNRILMDGYYKKGEQTWNGAAHFRRDADYYGEARTYEMHYTGWNWILK